MLGSAEGLARAAAAYTTFGIAGRPDPTAVTLCEEALQALGDDQPSLRAEVMARLAFHRAFCEGRGVSAAELADTALELARHVGDACTLQTALFVRALTLVGGEHVADRLALAEELLALAGEAGDVRITARGIRVRALARLELGDLAGFDADLARLGQLGDELRYWMYRSDAAQWRTLRALLDGRLHEVESRVEEMLALPGHDANYVHASLGQLFFLRRDQGRLHELTPSVAEAAERNPGLAVFGAVLAATAAGTGQREEAHRQLERFAADGFAGVPRDFTWMATLSFLTDACAALGDRGHAASLYELLRPHTGRLVVVGWGVACAGAAERYLGMLATTLGRWSEAAAYFDAALALEERIGAAPLAARTRTAYARMLLARGEAGDRAAAAELLGAALRACERQAMEGLAAEIRALAA